STPGSDEVGGVLGELGATRVRVRERTSDAIARWSSHLADGRTEVRATLGWHRDQLRFSPLSEELGEVPGQRLIGGDLATWATGRESPATVRGCADNTADDLFPDIVNCPQGDDAGYAIGGPGLLSDSRERRLSGRVELSQQLSLAGRHRLITGIELDQSRLDRQRGLSGGVFYDNRVAAGQLVAQRVIAVIPEREAGSFECGDSDPLTDQESQACRYLSATGIDAHIDAASWSLYLGDSWQPRAGPLSALTVDVGMRYGEQHIRRPAVLSELSIPGVTEERSDETAVILRDMWAPRVALRYDWTGAGRSILYAHWGRVYSELPLDLIDRALAGETRLLQTFDDNQCGADDGTIGGPSGPGCPEDNPDLGEDIVGGPALIAPGLAAPHSDELALGAEYEA
ncbi:MAG: hypothetical protein AAGC55_31435, partial [Myxococcota bacterium]